MLTLSEEAGKSFCTDAAICKVITLSPAPLQTKASLWGKTALKILRESLAGKRLSMYQKIYRVFKTGNIWGWWGPRSFTLYMLDTARPSCEL